MEISKDNIINELLLLTARAELQRGDGKLVALDDDEGLIRSFITDSLPALGNTILLYGSVTDNDDEIKLNLDMPSNWPPLEEQVMQNAQSYIVNYAAAKWYAQAGAAAEIHISASQTALAAITNILNRRNKPL